MLTLADLRRRARARLDDKVAPYLWSDEDLLDLINDTVRDAAIRANLTVEDDLAIPFTQKADLTYNNKYAIASGTLAVRSVYLSSNPTVTLRRTSMRRREQWFGGRPTQTGTPWGYALDLTQAGTGSDYGIQVRAITFLGTPTEADTAYMDIERLPALLVDDQDVPEIDEIWHPDLVHGITGYAFLKRDIDTYDPVKSKRDMDLFEERFGPRIPAVVMRERQTDVPLEMILE